MSGSNAGGGGADSGAARNPGGIRPAEPAPRADTPLTVEGGMEELRRRRTRSGREQQDRRHEQRQAPPVASERQAAEDEGGEQRQVGEEGGEGEQQQQLGDGGGEQQQGAGEPRFPVTIDGKPVELPVTELVAGYQRMADYTAKTQAIARKQSEFQGAFDTFTQARTQLEQRLAQFTAHAGSEFEGPIDWVKLATEMDPQAYAEMDARFKAWKAAKEEQQALAAQRARETEAQKQQIFRQANDYLGRALPGWKDDRRRTAMVSEIRDYAVFRGYTLEELDRQEVLDPRQILVLHDAAQYRKLVDRKLTPQPNSGGQPVPRGSAPAPQASRRETAAREQFEQDRSLKSAAAVARLLRHRPQGRR